MLNKQNALVNQYWCLTCCLPNLKCPNSLGTYTLRKINNVYLILYVINITIY